MEEQQSLAQLGRPLTWATSSHRLRPIGLGTLLLWNGTSHADPQQPRLPVGPGDAALRRRRRDSSPPPLATNP